MYAQGLASDAPPAARVKHYDAGYVVEEPAIGHDHLAACAGAVALLGRGAHDEHLPGKPGDGPARGDARPHRGGGDEVVAAAVPHPGQRVVLGEHGDLGPLRAAFERRLERGGHLIEVPLHLEAMVFEDAGELLIGFILLAPKLGVLVEVSRYILKHRPLFVNRVLYNLFE